MSAERRDRQIYSEAEIAQRVEAAAREIARAPRKPEIAVPVLAGAFVFAADLLRALAREGIDLGRGRAHVTIHGGRRMTFLAPPTREV